MVDTTYDNNGDTSDGDKVDVRVGNSSSEIYGINGATGE